VIISHKKAALWRKRSANFPKRILPEARGVAVQIAHLSGAGSYDDASVDEALTVFVAAIGQHDPRMTNVYFDVSAVAGYGEWEEETEAMRHGFGNSE
jgi:hypothetical protein